MILDGNLDLYKKIKGTENRKYVKKGKYFVLIF